MELNKSKQIKVLYIAGRVSIANGAYHSLLASLSELKKAGVLPVVLIHTHSDIEKGFIENEIDYKVIPYNGCTVPADRPCKYKGVCKQIINAIYEPYVKYIIKKNKIDLVHINVSTTDFGARSALMTNTPLVWHLREFLEEDVNLTYINKNSTMKLLHSASKVIAISDAVAAHFKENYGLKNTITIYNGIKMRNVPVTHNIFEKDITTFTLVGRITETKGQLEAIKALHEVLENELKAVRLLIVGDISNKEYYDRLVTYVEKNDLQKCVIFQKHQKDLSHVWSDTDIALICSRREGFGRVTAEFMLNGIPVIGSDTGGTPELLGNRRGLIYQEGNTIDLAKKMAYALEHKEEMIIYKENAFKYAYQVCTDDFNAKSILKVYQQIQAEQY